MGSRQKNARDGLTQLRKKTNTLIAIPNDRLLLVAPRKLPMETAFRLADDILRQSVQGISELITEPGVINVDFAHIRRLISLGGGALMSIGQGRGPKKVEEAIHQALHHPLLGSVSIENALGVIANFSGGEDLGLLEVDAALTQVQAQTGAQAEIVMGVITDPEMEDRVQVILVITGLGAPTLEEALSGVERTRPRSEPAGQATPSHNPIPQRTIVAGQPPAAPPITQAEPHVSPAAQPPEIMIASGLDVPAFLRRRTRYAG